MNPGKAPHGRTAETAAGLGSLLFATGTLICCALPLLLVTLGLGASVAAMTSAAPWLVALSQHKGWIFAGSAAALASAALLMYRPGRVCPADPQLAARCARLDRWNRRMLAIAATIWTGGFAVACVWLPLQRWLSA